MKHLLLAALLLTSLLSCKKQDVPPQTPQQLIVGTWHLVKFVERQTSYDGTLIRQDSTSYPILASPSTVTYNADSTTYVPGATTGKYSYVPPTITYSYNGVAFGTDFIKTVPLLTEHTFVEHSKQVSNTSTVEYWHTYER
jgi:hypothetical protein